MGLKDDNYAAVAEALPRSLQHCTYLDGMMTVVVIKP